MSLALDKLMNPQSVAIVGVSERPEAIGTRVLNNLRRIGFPGPIYPVNPKYQTVLNHVCYPSLTDLPEAPDVVVFSIRNPLIPEQMRLAVKRGARAAVIYDSGFAELGEDGARLQEEIAGLCREAGMSVCGPNCMGILNPPARVTTYKQTVMDTTGLAGNVGVISQSGSVCIAMLSDLRRFGISLSVSAGNEAVTRTVDYLEYLIDDPNTKAIATFTETVREPERYVAALDRAADVGKPVVVLKVGRSERAQRANEIPVLHVLTPCSCMLRDLTALLFNAAKTDIMMSRRGISRQVAAALSCRDFFRRRVVAAAARPRFNRGHH